MQADHCVSSFVGAETCEQLVHDGVVESFLTIIINK